MPPSTNCPPRRRAVLASSALAMCLLVALTGCNERSKIKGDATAGRVLAERNCSRCHAIGPSEQSPVTAAPPFRTLANTYKPEDLQEALAEGIQVGHSGTNVQMPEFRFEPEEVDNLISYLNTLRAGD
ncbi:MAG: cytochrome c [Pseudorhodoplanes sp.]